MTTEVMTDLQVKLVNHIKGLIEEYPEIMSEYTDPLETPEILKIHWFIWHNLEFKLADSKYGICIDCNAVNHMYRKELMAPIPEELNTGWELDSNYRCMSCSVKRWRSTCLSDNVRSNIPLYRLYPDEFFEQAGVVEGINNCGSCLEVMAEPEWVNYNRLSSYQTSVYGIAKVNDELEFVRMHKGCTERCQNCDIHYACSRFQSRGSRMYAVNSHQLCDFCFEEWAALNPDGAQCDTGCWVSNDDDLRWSDYRGSSYCMSCYDIDIECDDCGYCYHEDDGHNCDNDNDNYSSPHSEFIHSYTYKPSPNFFGDGQYHMGIELEIEDTNDNYIEGAEVAFLAMNPSRFKKYRGYLKSDGSLSRGFEIVSHPHTLKEFQTNFPWQMLTDLKKLRFRSWNTSTCGLHVHVSRTAFEDENHQIRFIKLIYDNQRQVQRIAGRTSNYATFSDKGNIIPKVKFKNQSNGRYAAVNVEPEDTVEVRVFRGSLHIPRVLSAIEFVDSTVQYTKELKIIPKDKPLSWVRYVGFISANSDKYPNLFDIINRSFDNESPSENVED